MPEITRVIQSYGVIRLTEESLKSRSLRLRCDILRNPKTPYVSVKTQPEESFYGYLTVVREGYIVEKIGIEFENQELWNNDRLSEFLHYERFWMCRFSAAVNLILQQFPSIPAPFVVNPAGDFVTLRANVDEFRIKLLTQDVIARLTLLWEPLYDCEEEETPQDPPPPEEPPVRPDGVDPPTSSDDPFWEDAVSQAYDGFDDDGRTYPPSDVPPEFQPPVGEDGELYTVSFRWDLVNASGGIVDTIDANFVNVRAPIKDYGLSDNMSALGSSAPGAFAIGTAIGGGNQVFTQGFGFVGGFFARNIRNINISLQ